MSSVLNPTYLLAPNWTFLPGGSIALGNIVSNPFEPHRVLSKPKQDLPETQTATEREWRLAIEKVRTVNLGIWATAFDQARVKLAAQNENAKKGSFTMDSLDTIYFKDEPSPEEIAIRAQEPRIKNTIRLGSVSSSPVYMITGLKIAKGFKLSHETSSAASVGAEASGKVAPGASLGANLDAKAENKLSDGFESGNDIIFAYQLLRIQPKGWGKNKTLRIDEFHDKAAFLGDDAGDEKEKETELENDVATTEVLTAGFEEDITAAADDLDEDLYLWLFASQV